MNSPHRNAAFYMSVALYAIYIFLVNWGSSAQRMNCLWAYGIFSVLANIVLIACCALVVYKIASDFSYYAKSAWFSLISIAMFAFLAFSVNSVSIVLPIILGFIGIGSQDRTIAKTLVRSLSMLLLISCALYFLGLNGGDSVSKPLFGEDSYYSVTMPALGMSNPNSVMLILLNIIAMSLYLCKTKKQNLYTSVLLFVLTIILSAVTGSTTGIVIGLAAILLIDMAKRQKKILSMFRRITPWAFLAVTIITFIVGISFGSRGSIPNPINDALTTRPYMWNLRIENDSYLNIYGNNDQYQADRSSGGAAYSLDNMTLYTLTHYGVMVYLIFFYLFYSGSKKIDNSVILVYVFVGCILMFVERMYLYSIVLIFLQKGIAEYYLFERSNKRILHAKS